MVEPVDCEQPVEDQQVHGHIDEDDDEKVEMLDCGEIDEYDDEVEHDDQQHFDDMVEMVEIDIFDEMVEKGDQVQDYLDGTLAIDERVEMVEIECIMEEDDERLDIDADEGKHDEMVETQ